MINVEQKSLINKSLLVYNTMARSEKIDLCKKCFGKGIIKEKDGTVHTCFECLLNDRFEQHGNPRDTGIRW